MTYYNLFGSGGGGKLTRWLILIFIIIPICLFAGGFFTGSSVEYQVLKSQGKIYEPKAHYHTWSQWGKIQGLSLTGLHQSRYCTECGMGEVRKAN